MDRPHVEVMQVGAVGIFELARPEKFNSLSRQCMEIISGALTVFETDTSIRAILIRAQGVNFCTGADLEEVSNFAGDGEAAAKHAAFGLAVLSRFEASHLPIIGAVQGMCLAGGLELMLACDVVLASASARFGDQHARYGLIPGWGGTQRLPRLIGLRRALDLFYSARWIDAPTAEQWGLVNRIFPDDVLRHEALAYCNALTKRNRQGIALMKRLARQGLDGALAAGLAAETAAIPDLAASPAVQEGLAAFMERREPEFQ